ncbi:hypothetical protein KKA17_02245 [bacterium]|nr:hypothetical protein [bacterium]MBU1884817.1 hypothetical protein [bacterium]
MSQPNRNRIGNNVVHKSSVNDNQRYLNRAKETRRAKDESFASQNVDINSYVLAPEGWEGLLFFIYFISIPYLVGSLFLFLFIAHASFVNLFIFDMSAFFIIWAIGYEVIVVLLLATIFISYLKYAKSSNKKKIR